MKWLLKIYIALFCLVLTGCDTFVWNKKLQRIDQELQKSPTHALKALESMQKPILEAPINAQMRYEVLKADAQNQLCIPFSSDTTMKKVVRWYYLHGGPSEEKAKVYYLMGAVYRDLEEYPLAVDYLLRSYELIKGKDFNREWNVLVQLSECYAYVRLWNEALTYDRHLLSLSLTQKEDAYIAEAYFKGGNDLQNQGKHKEAIAYFQKAQSKRHLKNSSLQSLIQLHQSYSLLQLGYIEQAKHYLQILRPPFQPSEERAFYYLTKTNLLIKENAPIDSVLHYAKKTIDSHFIKQTIQVYSLLSSYYQKLAQPQIAYHYELLKQEAENKQDQQLIYKMAHYINAVHNDYLAHKEKQRFQRMVIYTLGCSVLCLAIAFIACFFYIRNKKAKEQIYQNYKVKNLLLSIYKAKIKNADYIDTAYEQKRHQLQTSLKAALNSFSDTQTLSEIKEALKLLQQKSERIKDAKKELTFASQQITLPQEYSSMNFAKLRNTPLCQKLTELARKNEKASEEDFQTLTLLIDEYYPEFRTHLYTCNTQITIPAIRLCLLIKSGYRNVEIASLMCLSHTTITHKMERTYLLLTKKEGKAKDLKNFLSII